MLKAVYNGGIMGLLGFRVIGPYYVILCHIVPYYNIPYYTVPCSIGGPYKGTGGSTLEVGGARDLVEAGRGYWHGGSR